MTFEKFWLRIFLCFFAWLSASVLEAVLGWFNAPVVLGTVIALAGFFALWFFISPGKLMWSQGETVALIVMLALTVFIGIWQHDLPLGRDPVSYSVASIKVAETGSLKFHDPIAAAYHGFNSLGNDWFTSQFLPGYNVYLAFWYLLGGLTGLFAANTLIVFLTLLALYLVATRLSNRSGGLLAVLLAATFYSFIWFSREWASENLLGLAFWAAVAIFVHGVRERKLGWLLVGLLPISFTILIRGEGLLYLGFYLFSLVIVLIWKRREIAWSRLVWWWLLAPVGVVGTFLLYNVIYGSSYVFGQAVNLAPALNALLKDNRWLALVTVAAVLIVVISLVRRAGQQKMKLLWPRLWRILLIAVGVAIVIGEVVWWGWSQRGGVVEWSSVRSQFVCEAFHYYFLTILYPIIWLGFYKRVFQRLVYLIILLAFPALAFVLDPYIALDHPWFLRRFTAVLIVGLFVLAAIAIAKLVKTRFALTLIGIILVGVNLLVAAPILLHREHQGANDQIASLAQNFKSADLIVMTPGWDWQKWGYYLHFFYHCPTLPNREAFREADNFSNLLKQYDHVFVISFRDTNVHPFIRDNQLALVRTIKLSYPELKREMDGVSDALGENEGKIELTAVRERMQFLPPAVVTDWSKDLYIFAMEK